MCLQGHLFCRDHLSNISPSINPKLGANLLCISFIFNASLLVSQVAILNRSCCLYRYRCICCMHKKEVLRIQELTFVRGMKPEEFVKPERPRCLSIVRDCHLSPLKMSYLYIWIDGSRGYRQWEVLVMYILHRLHSKNPWILTLDSCMAK